MTKKYTITDIDWDNDDDEDADLPETETAEIEVEEDSDIDELLAEWLSDEYGYCVNGFSFEEVKPEPDCDGILDRIAARIDGCFGSVESTPGTIYIDEGGVTYAITATPCEPAE